MISDLWNSPGMKNGAPRHRGSSSTFDLCIEPHYEDETVVFGVVKEGGSTEPQKTLLEFLDFFPRSRKEQAKFRAQEPYGALRVLIKHYPEIFGRRYKFKALRRKVYPLALVCAFDMTGPTMEEIYRLCPVALDDGIMTSCLYGRLDALKWLLQKQPKSIKKVDEDGNLPLHYASMGFSIDVVSYVYDLHPASLLVGNKNGATPLHFACWSSDLPLVEFLMKKDPGAIRIRDSDGCTPFFYSLVNQVNLDVAEYLIFVFPELLRTKTTKGSMFLPLHYACYNSETTDIIIQLLDKYPEAVKEKDAENLSPLDLASKNPYLSKDDVSLISARIQQVKK